MACATRIFYLWQRPAQLGDGPRNWLTPGNTELGETSATRNFLSLTSCQYNTHLISVVVAVSANAEMLNPGDKELGKRVSFIFGDGQRNLATATQRVSFIFGYGQRNLATACAMRMFYLW